MLDLSSLEKALTSLEYAVERSQKEHKDEEVRDSVIQRFEYSYELSWKMLKRQLEIDSQTPASIDAMGFKEMIREGAERGLIDNPEVWFEYRRQRNITSHVYNETKAISVYETALVFLQDAKLLLQKLKQRNS
ncbi:Nucleotidyltransferase substrate binding protein [Candidatus Thiomargarita nelsonii]|uniref:Nucleotidyltransferase substrate binding protein n=1 Tax=Candidatus Thiomargarita nelsonii TaxID=1003181 RepID=A0A176S188_9GAMM|nr:Nucleotidyltransferase substrate binding protein [Candidatus Thiomargarita nelsonii]